MTTTLSNGFKFDPKDYTFYRKSAALRALAYLEDAIEEDGVATICTFFEHFDPYGMIKECFENWNDTLLSCYGWENLDGVTLKKVRTGDTTVDWFIDLPEAKRL